LPDIQAVIAEMGPLEGAYEFVAWVREHFQLIILSDTFYEFADPLMKQLNRPTIFCHKLVTDANGMITDYKLRQPDQKRAAVQALHGLNYRVIAAGDSYNDTNMLAEADKGILFDAPANVIKEFPQFPVTKTYAELKAHIISGSLRNIPE
jgi:phosphoserine/homoserine phosphotransferase